MTDLATIQQLSAAGRHQDCLQACQNALQASPEDASAYKYAGKSLLALGQFEKGQQFLLKAHELDTSNPEIVKDIGNIYLNLGNKDKALKWYQKALEINNNYAPALNNIANLKRQGGNHQQAIDLFKQAIQADPKLIQAYVGAAASFLALEDLDQAESFAAQALAINESTPAANEILGGVFQNKSNHDQAIECYQKELKIHPKASNSLLNLGLLFLQKGQTEASIYPLEKASALAPSEQCSLLLAQAYQNLGQFKEAIIEYKKLDINMSKNKIIPFNFGLCLLNTGNNIDAIKAFKIAIQLDELFIPAWGNVGIALTNEGKHREALPATQKVLKLDPNNLTALINLGEIYKVLGQLDQALAATLKSLELKPDNPDALINLGGIYKDLGQLDQALAATLKSLELKPDNPDVLINLGGIYKDLGQLDQALAATLKSLELKPDNPDALINLGGIYKDLDNLDQALAVTLKSLELKPDNPDVLMNLGIIYKDLGNIDQALAVTLKSLELKPDNPDALINLGIIHKDLGNIDQALAVTLKSLELKADNPTSQMILGMIYEIDNKKEHALKHYLLSAELIHSHNKKSSITSLISCLPILIQLDEIKEAKAKIIEIPQTLSKITRSSDNYSEKAMKNDQAYFIYLKELIPKIPLNSRKNISKSIHIGESHCLAFTNQVISMNSVHSQIKPSLIKGAKAWHLGNDKTNNFKICFQNVLKTGLGNYKLILLSFGEIDCRDDEGILKYSRKNNSSIEAVCQSTARGYVRWIASKLSSHQKKLILLGIPAPRRLKSTDDPNADKINTRRLSVICSFNKSLLEECSELMITFADVFELTSDENGFNNGNWMIDNVHLKPKAIHEIISHYLIHSPAQ